MPNFYYLCEMVPDLNDESIEEPSILQEFPYLQTAVQESATHPAIPQGRVMVKVLNIDTNMDRVILDMPEVSKFVPPADFPF